MLRPHCLCVRRYSEVAAPAAIARARTKTGMMIGQVGLWEEPVRNQKFGCIPDNWTCFNAYAPDLGVGLTFSAGFAALEKLSGIGHPKPPRRLGTSLDQSLAHREADDLGGTVQAELLHNASPVGVHGINADVE